MTIEYDHHSPSGLNLFAASPAMFTLERILGLSQPVGVPRASWHRRRDWRRAWPDEPRSVIAGLQQHRSCQLRCSHHDVDRRSP